MEDEEFCELVGLTGTWMELGVISPEQLRELKAAYVTGNDPHPEHYRWRAFKLFLRNHAVLDEATARSLYEVGRNDPDHSMGGSMMADILRRADCPLSLIESTAQSDIPFLRKIALEQLQKRAGKDRD